MLSDINFKISYSYEEDDIIEDFYVPALQNATYYRRATGMFGPRSLARAVLGFSEFFYNNGKMELVCSVIISDERFFQILKDYSEDKIPLEIEKEMLSSLENFQSQLILNYLEVLAWLLKENRLEIRFVLMQNKYYMYHKKIGIFKDSKNNTVSFVGSLNESIGGWDGNNETFFVFRNWIEGDEKFIRNSIKEFDRDWRIGKRKHSITYTLNEAIRKKILNLTYKKQRKQIEEFVRKQQLKHSSKITEKHEEFDKRNNTITAEKFNPFSGIEWKKPQIQGYESWIENNLKGILAIATGIGKTLIGIRALYEFTISKLNEMKKPVVIIGVHSNPMINQWREEISEWLHKEELGETFKIITTIHGEKKATLNQQIAEINMKWDWNENFIIIIRYDNLCNKLIHFLNEHKDCDILFIADEVHELGSEKRREKIKLWNPQNCLGLSATPERYFDKEGTRFLYQFFSNTIYNYEIGDAIEDGYLCEYDYNPVFCNLNKEEEEKYNKYSRMYAVEFDKEDSDLSKLKQILERRSKIIKKAESKYEKILTIIANIRNTTSKRIKHMLIYFEEKEQLDIIKDQLISKDIIPAVITQDEPKDKKDRAKIIYQLRMGKIPIVLAIQILDQGINIPELKYAIIAASTGNEKQYIQRRGRILRTKQDKVKASIYDLIIPISQTEINRSKIFYEDCSNREEVDKLFKEKGINLND